MAYSWIKVDNNLKNKPEVRKLTRTLGLASAWEAVGLLCEFWSYFDEYTTDGTLSASPEDLDDILGIEGFSLAMEAVGWLVIEDDSISIPEFAEHHSKSSKARAEDTRRKQVERRKSGTGKEIKERRTKVGQKSDTFRTKVGQKSDLDRERERERENKNTPPTPPGGEDAAGDVFSDLFEEMNSPDPFPEEQEPGRLSSEAVQQTADEFLIRWNRNGVLIPVDPIEFFNDRRLWGEFQNWARVPSRWKKLAEAMDKIESGKLTLGDHWRQLRKLICDPETVDKILAGSFEAKRKIGDKINPALQKGLTTRDRNFNLKLKAKPETAEMAK